MPSPESVNFLKRSNTLCLDIAEAFPGPKVPQAEWVDFIIEDVCEPAEVVETSFHSITGLLLLKVKTEDKFQSLLKKAEKGILWKKVNKHVFGWSTQDHLSAVRIINVTCHMDFDAIRQKMEEFGQVVHFNVGYHKKMPDVMDGSITVKMKLRKGVAIPSFIEMSEMGECLQLYNEHTTRVCFKCTKPGHIAAFCRNKAKIVDFSKSTPPSWAQIVSKVSVPAARGQTEEVSAASQPAASIPAASTPAASTPAASAQAASAQAASPPAASPPDVSTPTADTPAVSTPADNVLMESGDSSPSPSCVANLKIVRVVFLVRKQRYYLLKE